MHEDDQSRVAPLTAGDGGQDLPQSGAGGEVATIEIIVNGQPVVVEAGPIRTVIRAAIRRCGQIGAPVDQWELRTTEGDLIHHDALDGSEYELTPWRRLWLTLGPPPADSLTLPALQVLAQEQPRDQDGRLVLNEYGRECYHRGIETGKREAEATLQALRAYVQHKRGCDANEPDLSGGCLMCGQPVILNYEHNSAICDKHPYVQFFSVRRFPKRPCSCKLDDLLASLVSEQEEP